MSNEATASPNEGASHAATEVTSQAIQAGAPTAYRKRRPVWVFVPVDVNELGTEDPAVPDPPPPPPKGEKPTPVSAVEMPAAYHAYAIPQGPKWKDALNVIFKRHTIDLRNVHRVHIFVGEKQFRVEPQYNIRF